LRRRSTALTSGFSIFEGRLRVQNRSHYVDSTSHAQFKDLNKWLRRHSDALFALLQGEDEAAVASGRGACILYGEWLYAKHSVPYTRLPDIFIAFDLYDTRAERFVARPVLESRLAGTGIAIVPLVARARLARAADTVQYIGASAFYDGPAEGVSDRGSVMSAGRSIGARLCAQTSSAGMSTGANTE